MRTRMRLLIRSMMPCAPYSTATRIKSATSVGTLRLGQHPVVDFEHEQRAGEHQKIAHAAEQRDGEKGPPAGAERGRKF